MDGEEFIGSVRREASLESDEKARDVVEATLRTLGERITDGEASDVARHLPEELSRALTDAAGPADPFSLGEFTTRVSDRAGIDATDSIAVSRAVGTALAEIAGDELETAREQLPSEFDVIFEPGGPIAPEEFLETIRERAGIDSDGAARDATIATLGALGQRLSKGEAVDLSLYLPHEFKEAMTESGEDSATDQSLDEFYREVARRAELEETDAERYARAVCSTLAETASERELDAAKKQLPYPLGVIFDPPDATEGGA